MSLTKEQFDLLPPGCVFRKGVCKDDPTGANMTGSGKELRYIAKKGMAGDWCIYLHWSINSWDFIESNGDKPTTRQSINNLVDCDEDVFKLYRY